MKPIFTVHAGEYLVACHIEQHFPKLKVWIPSRDTGVDLLVTDARNRKAVSLQVKFSKDFTPTAQPAVIQRAIMACGWWVLDVNKIRESPADFWVFVLPSFSERQTNFIVVPPKELLRRLRRIHGKLGPDVHMYLDVARPRICWEARGASQREEEQMARRRFLNTARDFSQYLNAWNRVRAALR